MAAAPPCCSTVGVNRCCMMKKEVLTSADDWKDEGEGNSGENSWRTERSRTIQSPPTGAGTVSKQPPRTSLRRLVLCCAYEFDKRKKKTGEGLGILTFILP